MRPQFLILLITLAICCPLTSHGAEMVWYSGLFSGEEDVSDFGTVVEAFAFTGENAANALEGTIPLEDPFEVNGTLFTPLNFTLGDAPEYLQGITFDDGEFGHTTAEDGLEGLISGLAFQRDVSSQIYELNGLTVGQGYQVEFYYYHRTADRTIELDDLSDNTTTLRDGALGGHAWGYFVADDDYQEITATASTGSLYMSGYQLREVPEQPPIVVPPEPPASIPALIGYWNFDDNTQDQSGNGNHGVISGGVEYDDDFPAALGSGKSAAFDGLVDSHVEIEHNSMMPVTGHRDFTISMWVRGDGMSGDNNDDRIFSEGSSLSNDPLFNLGTKNDGADATVDFYYRNGGGPDHQFSVGEAFDDDWHHVLWVDENNVGTLYIDGELDTTFDYSAFQDFEADITSIGSVLRAADCCNFTGNIDDVSAFSFVLPEEDIIALANGESPLNIKIPSVLPGDYNSNGELDAGDLDLQAAAIAGGLDPPEFDLTGDGSVNGDDRIFWLHDLKSTWVGDADLNGLFDSGDFVAVFVEGLYETGEAAGWAQGDWNADLVFDSGDFVAAFIDGGYEIGAFPGAVQAVPEPSSVVLVLLGLAGLLMRTRHRHG